MMKGNGELRTNYQRGTVLLRVPLESSYALSIDWSDLRVVYR